eukprot:3589519-Amphidinium_carterae.1
MSESNLVKVNPDSIGNENADHKSNISVCIGQTMFCKRGFAVHLLFVELLIWHWYWASVCRSSIVSLDELLSWSDRSAIRHESLGGMSTSDESWVV